MDHATLQQRRSYVYEVFVSQAGASPVKALPKVLNDVRDVSSALKAIGSVPVSALSCSVSDLHPYASHKDGEHRHKSTGTGLDEGLGRGVF